MKFVLSCVFALSAWLPVRGADPSVAASWPCWRGADGSGWMPCDVPLLRDFSKMKQVWESEEKLISSSYAFIMGGAGGPVVADGKVFFFYMWPSGNLDEGYFKQHGAMPSGRQLNYLEGLARDTGLSKEELLRVKCLQKADDVIIALDLKTGKTLWKQVFKERNANVSMSVRGAFKWSKTGPHIIACAAYGKVATVGCGGDLYCLDAATGKPLWEKRKFRAATQKHGVCDGSPTFGGGLFIASKGAGAIAGLDPATGDERWTVKTGLGEHAMPIRWVHGAQECIIAGASCIEPKAGKALWTAPGAVAGDTTAAVQGDLIVFPGGAPVRASDPGGMGLNCYRMTPQGAEKMWALEKSFACGWNAPCIINGAVFAKVRRGSSGNDRGEIVCVDLASGKLLAQIKNGSDTAGSMIGIGDRLLFDGAWFDANPKSFAQIGTVLGLSLGDNDRFWASSHTAAPAGGSLIIIRGQNMLRCYDLQAK